MDSKSKEPGKRILQLAVRDAIRSKLSLNSSFKRELDRRKEYRWKIKEKKENPRESLVTKEMAEIFRGIEEEKVTSHHSSDKPSRQKCLQKKISTSMPDPLISRNYFEINADLYKDSDGSLTKELSLEQKKSVSTQHFTSTDLLEKYSSESLITTENTKNEFYIPPPYYPDGFFMPNNPDIHPKNVINSQFVVNKKNHASDMLPEQHYLNPNTYFNPENKRLLEIDEYYRSFSQPNFVSPRDILLTSNNSEKMTKEDFQNSQNLFWESKKSSYNTCKYKQLSPKKNDENEYINNLIDSFINKKNRSSSTEKIEKSINEKHEKSKAQNDENASFSTENLSSLLGKASMHKSQNTYDVPMLFLNFKNNVCKNEENKFEKEYTNQTEINDDDSVLSSQNEISVAVLCEFFKLQAMLN